MDAREPLVSAVIATNRASPFLLEAVDSVREQIYGRIELVVVDDGSDAAAAAAIAEAAARHPRSRVIRQTAAGVAAARNRGAEQSEGDFLAFLDDDDRWHPDRIAAHVAAHRAMPDAVASYCRMQTVDEEGRVLVEADQAAVRSRAEIAARRTGIIAPNLFVARTAFDDAGGFPVGMRYAEDLELVLRLAARGPFAFAADGLVDYRAHGGNTTRNHRALVVAIDEVLRRNLAQAVAAGDDAVVEGLRESIRKNDRFAWWGAARAARARLADREPVAALGELWWALRTSPRGLGDGLTRRIAAGRSEQAAD